MLLETIDYYNENDTDCYLLLLDASKAFDQVEYVKLFNTLRHGKMCPVGLRMLMNMYIIQQIQVKWNNAFLSRVILKMELNKAVAYLLVFLAFP